MKPRPIRVRATVAKHAMNQTESRYAEYLTLQQRVGTILAWHWEPIKLKLGTNWKTTYTPDFFVITPDLLGEFHEVKGFMMDDAAVKIKVAAKQYPWFTFRLARWMKKAWVIDEVA